MEISLRNHFSCHIPAQQRELSRFSQGAPSQGGLGWTRPQGCPTTRPSAHRDQPGETPAWIREAGWIRGSGVDIWELIAASQGQEKPLFPSRGAPGTSLCPRAVPEPLQTCLPSGNHPVLRQSFGGWRQEAKDQVPRLQPLLHHTLQCTRQSNVPFAHPAQATQTSAGHLQYMNQHRCRTQQLANSGTRGFLQGRPGPWRSPHPSPSWVSSTSRDVAPITGATARYCHGGLKEKEKTDTGPNPPLWCPPTLAQAHVTPHWPPPPAQGTPHQGGLCSAPRSHQHLVAQYQRIPPRRHSSPPLQHRRLRLQGPLPRHEPGPIAPTPGPHPGGTCIPALLLSVLGQKLAPFSSKPALLAATDAGLEEQFCRVLSNQAPGRSH